jgi:transcriptional regulator
LTPPPEARYCLSISKADIGPPDGPRRGREGVSKPTELMRGTLDLLILKTLDLGPRHGIGVADRIRQITSGTFEVKAGSLFPALHRLEQNGFIDGEWTQSPEGRRVKAYRLTVQGRRQLAAEQRQWARVTLAMARVLES